MGRFIIVKAGTGFQADSDASKFKKCLARSTDLNSCESLVRVSNQMYFCKDQMKLLEIAMYILVIHAPVKYREQIAGL